MSAEAIRDGKREKYQALEDAAINTHVVEVVLYESGLDPAAHVGKAGAKVYRKLTIKPNPTVEFRRSEAPTLQGFEKKHDVVIKGAFPTELSGTWVGGANDGNPTTKAFATPAEFRTAIEEAEYFLVNGERYRFRESGGFLQVDNLQSEWVLRLVRSGKQ